MTTDQKLEKLIEIQLNNPSSKKEDTSVTFSHKSVVTSLLIAGLIGIFTGVITVWNNDKNQDNNIGNLTTAIMQIQQNQVLLGDKFDKFANDPRYTKKQHDIENLPLVNDVSDIKTKVNKNIEDILKLNDAQREVNNKMQIFEIKQDAKK